jgi:purine-binding chemotaxis protein CheW
MITSPVVPPPQSQVRLSGSPQLVVLSAGGRGVGIPIDSLTEVVPVRPVTPLPGAPAEVCGLINVRGRLHTVVDLARCLGLPPAQPGPESRIAMTDYQGRGAGLLVDGVRGVIRHSEAHIELISPSESSAVADALLGVGVLRFLPFMLIEPDRLLQPFFD